MNKINILKTYFLKPNINYKHEIKIRDYYYEIFFYENNKFTLYFNVPLPNTYNINSSYYKIKQVKPNYIIIYCINMCAKRLTKCKNYDYIPIPINIFNYFRGYMYDLEFKPDLKIKK